MTYSTAPGTVVRIPKNGDPATTLASWANFDGDTVMKLTPK